LVQLARAFITVKLFQPGVIYSSLYGPFVSYKENKV